MQLLGMQAAAQNSEEVWFKVRSDGLGGSGTYSDPYNGVYASFRTNWNNLSTRSNLVIRLLPGTYIANCTSSGPFGYVMGIPKGSKVVGSGMHNTILQYYTTQSGDMLVLGDNNDGSSPYTGISDLTIDCNGATNTAAAKVHAIRVYARTGAIERVRVVNSRATTSGTEVFPIGWWPPTNITTFPNFMIRDCHIDGPIHGAGYGTGISLWCDHVNNLYTNVVAMAVNNRITDFNGIAIGTYGGNFAILDNQAVSVNSFYNSDGTGVGSPTRRNVIIRGNQAVNVGMGIQIGGDGAWEGFEITDNSIQLNDKYSSGGVNFPYGIHLQGNTSNFLIRNNSFTVRNDFRSLGNLNWYGVCFKTSTSNTGHKLLNNFFYGGLTNTVFRNNGTALYTDINLTVVANNVSDNGQVLPRGIEGYFYEAITSGDYTVTSDKFASSVNRTFHVDMGNVTSTRYIVLPPPADWDGGKLRLVVSANWGAGANLVFKVNGGGTSTTQDYSLTSTDEFIDLGTSKSSEAIKLLDTNPVAWRWLVYELESHEGYWFIRRPI